MPYLSTSAQHLYVKVVEDADVGHIAHEPHHIVREVVDAGLATVGGWQASGNATLPVLFLTANRNLSAFIDRTDGSAL